MEILGFDFEPSQEKSFIVELCQLLKVSYIDENIANEVIKVRQKDKIKLPDAIICVTAILNNVVLVTNDKRLQNIEGLKLRNLSV